MRIDVITIFPGYFPGPLDAGLLGKARANGIVEVRVHDLRARATDRHRTVDDEPFGGGPGMVMKPEPWFAMVESLEGWQRARRILLTPAGRRFDQACAEELRDAGHLVLMCGRYEGIDERVATGLATDEISVGDYVLSGGEVAALVVIDAVTRLVSGVVGEPASLVEESFTTGLLDHPHYTRPAEFRGMRVPAVLISGDHGEIERWRRREAMKRTRARRPDLLPGTISTPPTDPGASREQG